MAERRFLAVLIIAVAVVAGASACGVTSSGQPQDIGDAYAADAKAGDSVALPRPSDARDVTDLVRGFLKASAGGGESATGRLREYLTPAFTLDLPDPVNPPLTVIHLLGVEKKAGLDGPANLTRYPVEVTYQEVGILNERGRVDVVPSPVTRSMWFTVVQTQNRPVLAIDHIDGDLPQGIWLSDDALRDYYRIQPIYYWDNNFSRLLPDIRYLPLTQNEDARANTIVRWLFAGPSNWLAAQPVPVGTALKTPVVSDAGSFVVNLAAQANAPLAPEVVSRLYYQLRWSLRPCSAAQVCDSKPIKLKIEGQDERVSSDTDDLRLNESYQLGRVDKQKFDIVEKRVYVVPTTGPQVDFIKAPENVESAAVNRTAGLAAFVVVGGNGRRTLHVVTSDNKVKDMFVGRVEILRPVWIPETNVLLVIVDKKLYAADVDGNTPDLGLSGLTSISIAPDGRRVAYVQGGQAKVASLAIGGEKADKVTIGSSSRVVVPGLADAQKVAWTGEAWLYVLGPTTVWRSTVDSVLTEEFKLGGIAPVDMVALATWPTSNPGEVFLLTTTSAYSIGLSATPALDNLLKKPFFVS